MLLVMSLEKKKLTNYIETKIVIKNDAVNTNVHDWNGKQRSPMYNINVYCLMQQINRNNISPHDIRQYSHLKTCYKLTSQSNNFTVNYTFVKNIALMISCVRKFGGN